MLPRLKLTQNERAKAIRILRRYVADKSSIVKTAAEEHEEVRPERLKPCRFILIEPNWVCPGDLVEWSARPNTEVNGRQPGYLSAA